MSLLSDLGRGVSDLGLSQVADGRAAEITVGPSSAHGHVGNNDVFILTQNNLIFDLLRSSNDLTYIFGRNDHASYSDGGSQTIFDCGQGTTLSFGNQTGNIQVYGFGNDVSGRVVLKAPAGLPALTPDGHGGTRLGNIDFVGDAHLSIGQITVGT